ncbi:MAG: hypothetical protein ACRDOB_10825 [Streptosporangiaceae bacterium]
MKRNTPLLTLLTGAALGVILLIVNMVSYPNPAKAPTSYSAPATSAAASTPASAPAAVATSAAATPTPTPTAVLTMATFAGKAEKGNASVAVAVHGDKVIAYICNGPTVASWFQGTSSGGKVILTGKNDAHVSLTLNSSGTASGDVTVHETDFKVSMLPMVHNPAGLYIATATVGGKAVKAGWIVMSDGTQIGSILLNPDSDSPTVIAAPLLNVAAGTATYDGTVLHATQISGISGSGF